MRRRTYLGLASATLAGLVGCSGAPGPDPSNPAGPTPDVGCPAVLAADRTVCPTTDDAPVSFGRTSDRVSGEDWALAVTVTNRASQPYGTSPASWSVYRRDDRWHPLHLGGRVGQRVDLDPGERYTWHLSPSGGVSAGADHQVVLAPDPGTYAFVVPVHGPDSIAAAVPFSISA